MKDLQWMKEQLEKDYADGKRVQSRIKDGEKIEGIDIKSYWRGSQTANYIARCYLEDLDEPETLSREWIDDHKLNRMQVDDNDRVVPVTDLRKALVPKQERLTIPNYIAKWISEHHEKFDLYPALRRLEEGSTRDYPAYKWYRKNTRKFVNAYLTGEYEVEQEPRYYAKIKGHENIGSNDKYWNYNTDMEELSIGDSEVHPNVISEYMVKATKDEWANLGITDDNADFELVEELKECRKLIEKNMRY